MEYSGTLDDQYFTWLYSQIADVRSRNPKHSYWNVARELYSEAFVWSIPNDDNREADGKALRNEFIADCGIEDIEINWLQLDCSFLEMLIALSRRASFQSHGSSADWFWKFLDNLGIGEYTDADWDNEADMDVDRVLTRVNNRTYDSNGVGGLFPLSNPHYDQRNIELWYQLSAYLLEGDYVDRGPY